MSLAQTAASLARSQTTATAKSAEPQPQKSKRTNQLPIDTASTAQKLAIEARKRLPSVTETYVAYGVTEKLVKECGRQAAYSIPQRNEKDASIPKTKEGEDLGVGSGWWYDSEKKCYAPTGEQKANPKPALGLTPTFNTWAQVTCPTHVPSDRSHAMLSCGACANMASASSQPLFLHR